MISDGGGGDGGCKIGEGGGLGRDVGWDDS